jgi:hypothetical protein
MKSNSWRRCEMRKMTTLFLCMIMVFGMAACGAGGNETQSEATINGENGDNEMPLQTRLIIGTFKLEGTDLEVTAEQAPELLTLWKALQALSTSDTTASEEIDALLKQIQDAMTSEQMEAINAMDLAQGDMASIMEELNITQGEGFQGVDGEDFQFSEGFAGGGSPEGGPGGEVPEGGNFGGERPEGGFAGGGPGGGGDQGGGFTGGNPGGGGGQEGGFTGDGGFGQDLDPEQLATLQAEQGGRAANMGNRASMFLINPLILLLEGKIE